MSESGGDTRIIKIDYSEAEPLKDAAVSVDAIALADSMSGHFPGFVTKLMWMGDTIAILDSWKAPGLYLYGEDGKQIGCYARKGHGPDEFLGVDDFIVTDTGFELLDTYGDPKRISLSRNLEFIGKNDAEEHAVHMFPGDRSGGSIWYDRGNVTDGDSRSKLVYQDGVGRRSVLDVPEELENLTFSSYSVFAGTDGDTVLYMPVLEPRIFKLHKGEKEILCDIDFGDRWHEFTAKDRQTGAYELMKKIADDGEVHGVNLFADGSDIAVSFTAGDNFYILLMDRRSLVQKKLFSVDGETLENLGNMVGLKDGSFIFAEPGKIFKITV